MHLETYYHRPDISAVIHAHTMYATVMACLREPLPATHYMVAVAGVDVPVAEYATYGTPKLAHNAVRAMEGRRAVLLANHGILAGANDLLNAFNIIEEVEYCAQVHCIAKSVGTPVELPLSEMEDMLVRFRARAEDRIQGGIMSIKFVRIDDRLLHGQVVTTWLKRHDIEQAIIVSKEVEEDKTRQMILKLAAPSGLRVVFFSPEKLIQVLKKSPVTRSTMLLFTNPREVYECIEGGVEIPFLNVGNMSKTESNEKITAGVAVTEEDRAYFKKIIDAGVDVEIQMVPTDKISKMQDYIGGNE